MVPHTIAILPLLFLVTVAGDLVEEPNSSAEQEVRSILKEMTTRDRSFGPAIEAAKTQQERDQLSDEHRERRRWATSRLVQISRQHPGENATVDALIWVLAKGDTWTEARDEAFSLLMRFHQPLGRAGVSHLSDERIADLCLELVRRHTLSITAPFFRAAMHQSENRKVRAYAAYALALRSRRAAEEIEWYVNASPDERSQRDETMGLPFHNHYSKAESVRLTAESDSLFKQLIEDYGDIAIGPDNLDVVATAHLQRQRISIGQMAPEIEGEDADGKRFRLSAFRGNVVVLDFWGDW